MSSHEKTCLMRKDSWPVNVSENFCKLLTRTFWLFSLTFDQRFCQQNLISEFVLLPFVHDLFHIWEKSIYTLTYPYCAVLSFTYIFEICLQLFVLWWNITLHNHGETITIFRRVMLGGLAPPKPPCFTGGLRPPDRTPSISSNARPYRIVHG